MINHGTHYAYQGHGCRCDPCVEYHRRSAREWRKQRRVDRREPAARHVKALAAISAATEAAAPEAHRLALIAQIAQTVLDGGEW